MTGRSIKKLAVVAFFISATLIVYLIFSIVKSDTDTLHTSPSKPRELFHRVQFHVQDNSQNTAKVLAKSVTKTGESIELKDPVADVSYNGQQANIQAKKIIVQKDVCKAYSNVIAKLNDGTQLTTNSAEINIKQKLAKSNSSISIIKDQLNISSDSCEIDFGKCTIKLIKNVNLKLHDKNLVSDTCFGRFKQNKSKYVLHKAVFSGHVKYTSDTYNFATNNNVEYSQNCLLFNHSVTITGMINQKKYKLDSGNVTIHLSEQNTFKKIICRNKFIFYINNNIISGDSAVFSDGVVHALGNVSIKTEHGVVHSNRADYSIKSGKLNMYNTNGIIFRKVKK